MNKQPITEFSDLLYQMDFYEDRYYLLNNEIEDIRLKIHILKQFDIKHRFYISHWIDNVKNKNTSFYKYD
jgi:hypothetical protein